MFQHNRAAGGVLLVLVLLALLLLQLLCATALVCWCAWSLTMYACAPWVNIDGCIL